MAGFQYGLSPFLVHCADFCCESYASFPLAFQAFVFHIASLFFMFKTRGQENEFETIVYRYTGKTRNRK